MVRAHQARSTPMMFSKAVHEFSVSNCIANKPQLSFLSCGLEWKSTWRHIQPVRTLQKAT